MYDCIVVGAGPAGGSAAYHLAKRGRSVLLLEKEALPRYKPCGGGISPQIAQWFDFSFEPVIVGKVDRIRFTWKLEDPVEALIDTTEPMWIIDRRSFDHYVVKQAEELGAVIKDATPVTGISLVGDHWDVQTSNGSFSAQYLIAADGAAGPLAGWLGFKGRKLRTAVVVEAPGEIDPEGARCSHAEFGLLKNGYLWNFPKQSGWTGSGATFLGNSPKDLEKTLATYMRHFNIDAQAAEFHTTKLYVWDGDRPLHKPQALLAGETAGLVDPFSAEGVRPSMLSGMRAAEAIDAALNGQAQALADYSKIMKAQWGDDMGWSAKIAAIFFRIAGIAYQVGVKRPSARARMGKILSGDMKYSEIATRAIKRLSTSMIPGRGGK